MDSKFVLPKIGELPVSASLDSICKFEKVPTLICPTADEGAKHAADIVVKAINSHKVDGLFVLADFKCRSTAVSQFCDLLLFLLLCNL